MYIVQIASELAPVAKVGGLGDVLYGLSKELCRLGHTVEIILPKYDCLRLEETRNLKVESPEFWSYEGLGRFKNTVWSATVDNLRVLFIEPHHPGHIFSRGVIYGCKDDVDRFCYFSRAAMEFLYKTGRQPDAIHVHDWPTSLIPVLYEEMYKDLGYRTKGTVLTLHNMAHQGQCQLLNLNRAGLKAEKYLSPDKMQDPHNPKDLNLLKGGIVYANKITTVSPAYVREIQTAEGGFGLQDVLIRHNRKLKGILNGIDEEFWNPERDPHLVQHYPVHNVDQAILPRVLAGKQQNRTHLSTHFGLQKKSAPLIASISRLVPQKGPELIQHALYQTLEKGGQFILLGSSLDPSLKNSFEIMQKELKDNPDVAILMDNDEALAHQIYASSDMFVIPSIFEPCGLTQMIALRYGSIPIVRRTGGLADTVFDADSPSRPEEERNGFTFENPDPKEVGRALNRALTCYTKNREKWNSLILNGMRHDFSWKGAALEYVSVYQGT